MFKLSNSQPVSEIVFTRSSFTQARRACQDSFFCKSNTLFKVERVAGAPLHLAQPWFHE
jgi:hypothetical protein